MSKRSSIISDDNNFKSYFVIGLITFAVFANTLSNDFVFDDESVILSDPTITKLSSIPKYFTAQEGFHKVIGRYYRPVVSTSYAIDCAIWGLKPFGFHLTNVLIHVLNTLLVFRFLQLILEKKKEKISKENTKNISGIGALIFAVHPIHAEAVSWVSGRTDSLAFTFFIASFIYYLKCSNIISRNNKRLFFFFSFIFYILALLAKEMAITLPLVIVSYDFLIEKYNMAKIKEKLKIYSVFITISIIYAIVRWFILKDVPERETYYYFYAKDFSTTFFTMLQTIPLYLRLMVFPVGLVYHYSGYMPYVNSFQSNGVIVASAIVSIIILLTILFLKKQSLISYSFIYFFVTLSPVLNIIPTMNFVAERFLYIPSIALILLIVYVFCRLDFRRFRTAIFSVSFLIILILGILTVIRNTDWKNNDSLFLSAEGKPGTVLYVNIGNIYANKQQYDIAEKYYRLAIELRDETLLANDNLGKIFMVKGNFDSAYYYMTKSIKLDTLSPEPRYSLAQLYVKNNMIPQAIEELEKMHKIVPNYMNSSQMLAELKQQMQNDTSVSSSAPGKKDVVKVAQLEKESYTYYNKKEYEKAVNELKELAELNPRSKSAYYNNIGMCYKEQNKLSEAKKYFELSIEANNKFSTAYNNLGSIFEKLGDTENARKNYRKAIECDPGNKSATDNLNKLKN
jgi:tetratricopeptide (TPR) repeat protein